MSEYPNLSEEEVRDVLMNEDGRSVDELRVILQGKDDKRHRAKMNTMDMAEKKKQEDVLNLDMASPSAESHKNTGFGSKYTVKSGDSLGKIAEAYASHYGMDVTSAAIAAANKMKDPNKVKMGSVLDMSKFVKKD